MPIFLISKKNANSVLRNDVGYTPMKRRGESRAWVILWSYINRHTLKLRKTNHVFVALAGSQDKRPKKPTGITHDAWNMWNGCCSEVRANTEPWERFVKTILFQLWLEKLKSRFRGSQTQRFCPECLQHFSQNCDLNRSSSTSYVYIFSSATVVISNFSNNTRRKRTRDDQAKFLEWQQNRETILRQRHGPDSYLHRDDRWDKFVQEYYAETPVKDETTSVLKCRQNFQFTDKPIKVDLEFYVDLGFVLFLKAALKF